VCGGGRLKGSSAGWLSAMVVDSLLGGKTEDRSHGLGFWVCCFLFFLFAA